MNELNVNISNADVDVTNNSKNSDKSSNTKRVNSLGLGISEMLPFSSFDRVYTILNDVLPKANDKRD